MLVIEFIIVGLACFIAGLSTGVYIGWIGACQVKEKMEEGG